MGQVNFLGKIINFAKKTMLSHNEILGHFLPENLLEYFEIKQIDLLGEVSTQSMFYNIYLDEINTVPLGYESQEYESKGFSSSSVIQDFPIRGKGVYLHIRKRRWRHKQRKNEIIQNDYSFVSAGSKFTLELAAFLKDTGR